MNVLGHLGIARLVVEHNIGRVRDWNVREFQPSMEMPPIRTSFPMSASSRPVRWS